MYYLFQSAKQAKQYEHIIHFDAYYIIYLCVIFFLAGTGISMSLYYLLNSHNKCFKPKEAVHNQGDIEHGSETNRPLLQ